MVVIARVSGSRIKILVGCLGNSATYLVLSPSLGINSDNEGTPALHSVTRTFSRIVPLVAKLRRAYRAGSPFHFFGICDNVSYLNAHLSLNS